MPQRNNDVKRLLLLGDRDCDVARLCRVTLQHLRAIKLKFTADEQQAIKTVQERRREADSPAISAQ